MPPPAAGWAVGGAERGGVGGGRGRGEGYAALDGADNDVVR